MHPPIESGRYEMGRKLIAAVSAFLMTTSAFGQEPPKPEFIVVGTSGGIEVDALQRAFFDEFEAETGIEVRPINREGLGPLRAMVESGNVDVDVITFDIFDANTACEDNLLEPIDDTIVDRSEFLAWGDLPCALAITIGTSAKAYLTETYPDGGPVTWADFWDTEAFPGVRTMRNSPFDNLEFALLADGVAPEDLYPLDLDRAFAKLDEIYPHVGVWWESAAQPAQLLIDGEVEIATGWNGRFYNAVNQGVDVTTEFYHAAINSGPRGIPRGSENAYWAQQLLAIMAKPENQAVMAEIFGYGGTHRDSLQYVSEDIRPLLPSAYADDLVEVDFSWWNENGAIAVDRWNRWMLSKQ